MTPEKRAETELVLRRQLKGIHVAQGRAGDIDDDEMLE